MIKQNYAAVKKIDDILGKIKVKSITETNKLKNSGAVLVTEMVGIKIGKTGIKKEPWWKRRLEGQILLRSSSATLLIKK